MPSKTFHVSAQYDFIGNDKSLSKTAKAASTQLGFLDKKMKGLHDTMQRRGLGGFFDSFNRGLKSTYNPTMSFTNRLHLLRQSVGDLAGGNATGFFSKLGGSMSGIGPKLASMAEAAAPAAAAIGAVGAAAITAGVAIGRFIDKGTQLNLELIKMGTATGLSGDSLTELWGEFRMTGIEAEAGQKAVYMFSRKLYEARTAGTAGARMFTALGINIRRSNGSYKALGDVLAETRSRLSKTRDVTARNALAMQAFGRGAKSLQKWLTASTASINEYDNVVKKMHLKLGNKEIESMKELVKWQRKMALQNDLLSMKMSAQASGPMSSVAKALSRVTDAMAGMYDVIMKLANIGPDWYKNTIGRLGWLANPLTAIPNALGIGPGKPLPIPGMAGGGIVRAQPGGTIVRLAEGGQDEAVVPLTNGRGKGRSGAIHIHINSVVGTDERAARQLAEMVGRHLARGVMRQMVGQNV